MLHGSLGAVNAERGFRESLVGGSVVIALDVGGTGIKGALVDADGHMMSAARASRARWSTPTGTCAEKRSFRLLLPRGRPRS